VQRQCWVNDHWRVANCGGCIRNDASLFVCAATAWDKGTHSIMESASHMHLEHIVFESDSQLVVNAMEILNLVYLTLSIKILLVLNSNFEVKFVKHQANSVAHLL
jgi:DNA transposition AAA+ family ATPase